MIIFNWIKIFYLLLFIDGGGNYALQPEAIKVLII
jgi:hypothetical protein